MNNPSREVYLWYDDVCYLGNWLCQNCSIVNQGGLLREWLLLKNLRQLSKEGSLLNQ